MRSISSKLILAFLTIGIVSVAAIFATAIWNTRAEFIRFLTDETRSDIVDQLARYHRIHGSWVGVETLFTQGNNPGQPGMGSNGHRMRFAFVLADEYGRVILSGGGYRPGQRLSAYRLRNGIPITEEGRIVGTLIPLSEPFEGGSREMEFIQRINRTLLYGALAGAAIALLLGVLLSRTLTRPIRELTRATHAVAEGNLSQQVPVRSNDELGELARAFNKMSSELLRSVNARKQMTADIAHELRTPLSLILGHAEAVHDGVLPPSRENFEIIREEAARLEHLVDDLRTLSLADAGELRMSLQTIEPERLLQEVASLFQYQTQRKDIDLRLEIVSPIPAIVVDPGRMTQVLTNVMDNAIRYTPEGGTILLSAKEGNDHVQLAVHDSGPGLNAEELRRIFNRFYRADVSRQREDGGSGLGLAIAKSIVEAHGGQISAESEPGHGLSVMIRLPKKSSA